MLSWINFSPHGSDSFCFQDVSLCAISDIEGSFSTYLISSLILIHILLYEAVFETPSYTITFTGIIVVSVHASSLSLTHAAVSFH